MADQEEHFPVEGIARSESGKSAGLYWINFSNIEVHGVRGTPEYMKAMALKGRTIAKIIETEFRLGTRHFNKALQQLKTPDEVFRSYAVEKGVFVEIKDRARREKFEAMAKQYGMETIRDGADPSRTGSHREN
jgi:hypothetical protein